jgi:predicted nucleic acid-binding protein
MKVFFDSSVLVASLVARHPHHARAMSVVSRAVRGRDAAHVAAHGLAETYAVLTTLPLVPRIAPDAAQRMIKENLLARCEVVTLTAAEYEAVLASLAERGISGGATYDAIHAACARKVPVKRLFTFNVNHFHRVAPDWEDRIAAP